MKKVLFFIVTLLLIQVIAVIAQTRFRVAERFYKKMQYANAIEAYEEAFKYKAPTTDALVQLADSYFKVGDTKNAERVYSSYVSDTTLVSPDIKAIFQYAHTLSQNGKYVEASNWFEKYHRIKTNQDTRGEDYLKAYRENIHDFYKDSTLFNVFRLDINSPQSDFSPVFYGKGIVFASNRKKEDGVRRVHGWNNTAFLDLYYVDTSAINQRIYDTHLGEENIEHRSYSYLNSNENLHPDETHLTSNDSKTVGYHAHVFKNTHTEHHSSDPIPFSSQLNSKYHDGPCTFNHDQSVVVFSRNNSKKGFSKKSSKDGTNKIALYISRNTDSTGWSVVEPFPFNSTEYSTAHPAFSNDGKTLYFSSDLPGGFGGMDIYKTYFDGKRWTRPENLGAKVNTEGNEVFPYADEHHVLYFASNGHPGLGGLDLFKFEDDKVTHLNYPLSSKKDDFGIVVWADGRKGYLSSNRDFGGYDDDLYYFRASKLMMLSGKTIDALTKKVLKNTVLVLKDQKGKIIAQTVSDSAGNYTLDIEHEKQYNLQTSKNRYYDTTLNIETSGTRGQILSKDVLLWNKLNVALLGAITDKETGEPLEGVRVKITDTKTGKEILNTETTSKGGFKSLPTDRRYNDTLDVDIHVAKDKYLTKTIKFKTIVTDSGEIELSQKLDLFMDKVKIGADIGKLLNLNPIYYDLGKWDIREDAAAELDKVAAIMQENPTIVIELGSHTDCRSSKKYNQDLSDKRAKSSAAYIVSKGIEASRIYGKGYGESKLINNCGCEGPKKSSCTEEEHQLNRRTEFLIVKM